mmetsp:Transcript_1962/g.8227  ORF Transcript_1962/g.8227 Transcript_1962/m.8227 type:complete len:203 (+) Transcript_1962:1935-2543(+)
MARQQDRRAVGVGEGGRRRAGADGPRRDPRQGEGHRTQLRRRLQRPRALRRHPRLSLRPRARVLRRRGGDRRTRSGSPRGNRRPDGGGRRQRHGGDAIRGVRQRGQRALTPVPTPAERVDPRAGRRFPRPGPHRVLRPEGAGGREKRADGVGPLRRGRVRALRPRDMQGRGRHARRDGGLADEGIRGAGKVSRHGPGHHNRP